MEETNQPIDNMEISTDELLSRNDETPIKETPDEQQLLTELADVKEKMTDLSKSHLLLMADFDNFRKRTLKEKSELIKSGGENALKNLLPVIDDFERAIEAIDKSDNSEAVSEGIKLIYSKFISYLNSQGISAINTAEAPFDTEYHEAITTIPAPSPELTGKVIDCVQKGYTLNEKVIRFAKVVVGQ